MTSSDARGGAEDLERLLAQAAALPLKEKVRLLDELKTGAIVEHPDGLRFHVESLGEYRRAKKHAKKRVAANTAIEGWIATFDPADVLFDIGANIGGIALHAARRHAGRLRVLAFEPAADSFAALVRNVAANGLAHAVTPLQVALFDTTGILPLHRASIGAGTALHAVGEPIDFSRRPFEPVAVESVLAFRLDDLVPLMGLPRPTRIKLDVDGVEDRVLAGAADVLAGVRDVFVELVEARAGDPHPAGISAFFGERGFRRAAEVEHTAAGVYPRVIDALYVRS